MKFLDKFHNLLVIMNLPTTTSGIRSIIKDAIDVPKMIRHEGPDTLKAPRTNQNFSTYICNIFTWITLRFQTIQPGNTLLQIIL